MATPIEGLMDEAMKNIRGMVDANTIVGDVITTQNGATIIPVTRVSLGFAAGGSEFGAVSKESEKMFGGGSGGGVSMNPVAFLVITKDSVRVMPVSSSISTAERIVDAIPELLGKLNSFVSRKSEKTEDKSDATDETEEGNGITIELE